MDNPIDSILNTYPSDFFRSLEERTNAAFMKAHHLTCEYYAEPEQVNMLGQARHACCEEELQGGRAGFWPGGQGPAYQAPRRPLQLGELWGHPSDPVQCSGALRHAASDPLPQCVGGAERLAGSHPARSAAGRAKAAIGAALRDDRRDRAQTIR